MNSRTPQTLEEYLGIDEHDPYTSAHDPHGPRYLSQSRYTGPDFRQVAAQERDRFPGQPTRIDLVTLDDGQVVKRTWLAGWEPGDRAHSFALLAAGWTLDSAADHLEAQGWTVHRWPGHARAWRIALRPVRTGEHMRRYRDRLMAAPPPGVTVSAANLLYDL